MPEYHGDEASVLPNLFPNPGTALQNYINNQQRNSENLFEQKYRLDRQREADEWRKIWLIKTEVNPEDVATGNVDANTWFDSEAKRVQKEILTDPNLKSIPPTELYGMIQQKWLPVVQGAQAMKTGFSQIDQNTKQIGTENPNIATDKLSQSAKMNFLNDWMPVNPQTGKREFKNQPHLPDKNYAADIVNSPDRWRYIQGGALEKYLTKYKTEDISPYKQLGKDQSLVPYKGGLAPWSELNVKPDINNKIPESANPQVRLKTQDDYITEGGQRIPIKVLDKEVYKKFITDIPQNDDDLTRMWEQNKQDNNLHSKNTVEDEKRKRAFAIGVFQQHDPSEIHGMTPQHLPRNTTNNYIGGSKEVNVNDVHKLIEEAVDNPNNSIRHDGKRIGTVMNALPADAQSAIFNLFGGKRDDFNEQNTFLHKEDNGDIKLYRVNEEGIPEHKRQYEVGTISKVAVNLKTQPGAKEKREVIKEGNMPQQEPPKGKTYKYGGYDYSEEEVKKAAHDEGISVDEYIKKHGLK